MACNCATKEQLDELYRKYGEKKAENESKSRLKFKTIIKKIGIIACLIVITPFLFAFVIYKAFGNGNHKISVRKFFNLHEKQLGSNVG